MGEYFKVVNESKKEFFDPSRLGESEKQIDIGTNMQGRLLGLLLVDTELDNKELVGSWSGDRIIIAGDTGGPEIEGSPFYFMVESPEYADITIKALAILCGNGFVSRLVSLAKTNEILKKDLFKVVETFGKVKNVHLGGLEALLKDKSRE